MNWYTGNIAEAVNLSKAKKSIFVVYVEGTDDLSKKLTSFINDPRICKYLDSEDFIAIKIQSGSEGYMQFAQIYQLVPLPSIFFIGKNGTPMDVVTGITSSVDELEQKIKIVLERAGKEKRDELLLNPSQPTTSAFPTTSSTSNASANLISSEQSQNTAASSDPNIVCNDGVCYKKPAEEKKPDAEQNKSKETKPAEKPITEVKAQPSTDEKLERAKEIIEQKRKEKEDADAELEKEREVRRRKEGQDVINLKKWQEEQEIKQLKDDRKREKLEEQAVRKRILEQIEQDKAERAQKFGHIVNPPNASNDSVPGSSSTIPKPTTPKSENSEFARIQFKKPGGDTEMHIFGSQDAFQVIRNYVLNNILVGTGIRDFTLATTFPRREFTELDNDQKLVDLGLSPTAVLLILPKFKSASNQNTVAAATRGIYEIATAIIWNIFTPVMAVYGYIRNLIFARRDVGAQKRASEETVSDNDAAKRRNISGRFPEEPKPETSNNDKAGPYKRVGGSNIHRLHESRDSDDENNTWNGNSTQQQ